jgi:hypothetical protein
MSIWRDITHDAALARDAIDELERLASHIEGLTDARQRLAEQAMAEWRGGRRMQFDHEFALLQRDSASVIVELRRTATRIAAETEQACAEQRRRERARALLADLDAVPG